MKIAICIPYIEGIGGHQRVIARLANYLLSMGHHVELFAQRYDLNTADPGFKKLKINTFKIKSKLFSPLVFLSKKIKNFDTLVVGAFPATLLTIRNKPTFYICYTPKRDFNDLREYYFKKANLKGKLMIILKNLLFKKIDFIAAQKATIISPISKTIKERTKKYYKRDTEGIIYPGIDFNNYKSGKYEDYILCPSRLILAKRVDFLVKAMKHVKNKKIKLYVVGDGSQRKEIEKLAGKYSNVKYLGRVSDEKLLDLYANCLAVAYIPINEDWGLVPVEAAAAEKATIGSKEGGLRETIIDNKTGFLIQDPIPKKIAEKIDYLANNKKVAIKMGKQAKKYAKQFDWKNLLPEWERLILKSIKVADKTQ